MVRSYTQFRKKLSAGGTSCVEEVSACLKSIEDHKSLNAYVEVWAEEAMAAAKVSDQNFELGVARPLEGLVVSLKDVISYKGHALQASSKILEGYISPYNSTVVERLSQAGAIFIGRVSCDEFAMGSSNESAVYGPVKNPLDESKVPGGSSGGSAASVAAGTAHISIGSDTGGSVRQPASFCGIVGFKPTYSRISRFGLIAYASSFDCIGILSPLVEDAALVMEVIAGHDPKDATSSKKAVPEYHKQLTSNVRSKKRIALINDTIEHPGLQPAVKENINHIVHLLKEDGHEVEKVNFPLLDYILPVYYILTTAEASSNLSRFDGIRYGYRSNSNEEIDLLYKNSRSEGFGNEVKRRILLGTFVLSASYYDAYYTKAQKVRRLVREQTLKILDSFDFILTPTTPSSAFEIGKKSENPVESYLADLFTVQASVAGLPGISIPSGKDSNGLPFGIQLVGRAFEEGDLMNFSHQLSQKVLMQV